MSITADTNLLVRAVTEDDPEQALAAQRVLANSELVALTMPALCETVWLLSRLYRMPRNAIADAIRLLTNGSNVATDRAAVEAGLAHLDMGGDFADGVIAHDGQKMGSEIFLSFDKNAIRLAQMNGVAASWLEA